MPSDADLVFLRSAVECGALDESLASEVIEAVGKVEELGASASAQEIAVNRGFLTAAEAEQVASHAGNAECGVRNAECGRWNSELRIPNSALPATDRVGNFQLVEKLGVGGMGVVYRARQLTMDRDVALKILPPRLATNRVFVKRFLREARSAARLNHPNIVQGIDVGAADGLYYFAMELVEGEDLKSRIDREGRISEADALDVAVQIARALEHANSHGIIHRDIKPDNILLANDGSVKLADLGLAKHLSDAALTQQLSALGTPLYMSPEQARGVADIDTRTDLYALGATLYHAVAGSPPFVGAAATEIISKHLFDPPRSPREVVPELSEGFCYVILRMLRKRPEARHQSPAELLEDLERLAAGRPPVRAASRTPTRPARRTRRRRRRSPLVAIFVTTAAFILAAGAWLLYNGLASATERAQGGPARQARPSGEWGVRNSEFRIPHSTFRTSARAPDRSAAELERIQKWADAHPDDLDGALRRLRKLIQTHPKSLAAAQARSQRERIEARVAAQERRGLREACHRAKRLAAADRFAAAVDLLDKFALANRQFVDEIAEERGFVLSQSAKAEREVRDEARRLADRGDFAGAIRCLEKIAAFGIPKFTARATREIGLLLKRRDGLARRTREGAERAYLALRIEVGEHLKARRRAQARAALAKALADPVLAALRAEVEADVRDLDALDALWSAAEAGAGSLRPGERFSVGGIGGTFERFDDGVLHIRASGIVRNKGLDDLTTNEIIGLARRKLPPDAPRTHLAIGLFLLAEGKPERAKEAFGRARDAGGDVERCLELLERQRADATEADARALLGQATAAAHAERWEDAAELLGKLEKEFGETRTLASQRETFGDLALEARLHTLTVADLFHGRCRIVGNGRRVELAYDFEQPEQLADWVLVGGEWSLGSGHLTARGAAAVLRAPVLRDAHGTVELAALPGPGGEWGVFLSERDARRACYTLMLPDRGVLRAALCVARRPVMHAPLVMRPRLPHRVSIVLRDRRLSAVVDGRELAAWTDERKTVPPELAFGVGAKGARAMRLHNVRLVAALSEAWVDRELERLRHRLHQRHEMGKKPWRQLFNGTTLAPWRPEHGPWDVVDGALTAKFAGSAALRDAEHADLEWRVKVRPRLARSVVRLSFRVARNGQRYALGLGGRPEDCRLALARDGAAGGANVLARYAKRVDWQADRWYDLHVVAVGSELRAELDGALLCLVRDARLARGWLSLDVLLGGAAFKDVSFRALD